MSPEQIKNARNVDARADIWSMGVILYKLLTNHKPFNGDTMGEVFAAIFEETPKPIRLHRPDVPPPLEQIILGGCLQRNRDQRFRNVAELAAALGPFGLPHSNLSVERIRRRLAHVAGGDKSSISVSTSMPSGMAQTMGVMGVGGQVDPSSSVSHVSQVSQSYASGSQPSYASQSQGSTSTSQSHASQSHSSTSQSHSSVSHPSQGTAAPWAQTSGGAPPSSKGPLIAIVAVLALLVIGGGAFAIKTVLGKSAANPPQEDPRPTATQTSTATATTAATATTTATGAPSDSALSIDSLPTAKTATTATTTATAGADTAKPNSTSTSTSTSRTAKPKDSAPSDDVLKMRR
jgi:serine/threonine-protein kinase